jgi:hypothetical protein
MMVACNNTPTEPEQTNTPAPENTEVVEEKQECPMHALKDKFAKWEELDEAGKATLVEEATKVFADMDAKMEEVKANGEEACKDMTEEMKAKCEEMKTAWANFENLDLEGKKDLILKRLEGCGGDKPCCKHEEAPAETSAETPAK